jgi:NTP pyrophosphatase (non-canonical NTP hydrolase)
MTTGLKSLVADGREPPAELDWRAATNGISWLCELAFQDMVAKGFHGEAEAKNTRECLDLAMLGLVVTEVSEAMEEVRRVVPPDGNPYAAWYTVDKDGGHKPCGVASELADACIRIFNFCGARGIDLAQAIRTKMEYNRSRPAKHGKTI